MQRRDRANLTGGDLPQNEERATSEIPQRQSLPRGVFAVPMRVLNLPRGCGLAAFLVHETSPQQLLTPHSRLIGST